MLYDYLYSVFTPALAKIGVEGAQVVFEVPKVESHGDASTNVAMTLAKQLGKAPRVIAQEILDALVDTDSMLESVSIAGAGFINVTFKQEYYALMLSKVLALGANFGKNSMGAGKSANVEYVSANPTGPLHPGHGRNIMLGDCIANLLEWSSYNVVREYYFNNAGNQMNNLAKSIHARYNHALGNTEYPFPEDGYHGEYIKIIAEQLVETHGDSLKEATSENLAVCRKNGEEWCFDSIKKTLQRLGVQHDVFFNEHSLYEEGKITEVVDILRDKGLVYESEGATWIKTSELGLEKDKVIIKSTGEPTYRLPDMAYHRVKCERGDDVIVDIFGADHISTVQEVIAGVKAMGYDTEKIKVVLHQMVSFLKEGVPFKLSKRNGEQYTLNDLLDDLGEDVVRFFFSMRSADTQLQFDLTLAQEQSDKNPVFYLQYAHARINSIFTALPEKEIVFNASASLAPLVHPNEIALIKKLLRFPLIIQRAAQNVEPHTLADYLREIAAAFHAFYHDCRIIGSEESLLQARLNLAFAAKTALFNGLSILGIKAPEKM